MRENQRRADEDRKNRELGVTDYLGEPMEVVNQSITGAAESVLETAELIGDTGKTFLNQLFPEIVPLEEKDNIFSDKYQAFQWDLGSDQMAKTGITARSLLVLVSLVCSCTPPVGSVALAFCRAVCVVFLLTSFEP